MTDPDNVEFTVGVSNDEPAPLVGDGGDGYGVNSINNLPLPNGASVNRFWLSLSDSSYSALSSDALPTTAPVLDDWETRSIQIRGGITITPREGLSYRIGGGLTSAVLIPEPATVILVGLGGLALLRKGRSLEL